MITKEEMLEAIQEKIWRKDLTYGCEILIEELWEPVLQEYWYDDWGYVVNQYYIWPFNEIIWENWDDLSLDFIKDIISWKDSCEEILNITIEWHPVMFWDTLDWLHYRDELQGYSDSFYPIHAILDLWKHKRQSIYNQPKKCIEYIYNLIKE